MTKRKKKEYIVNFKDSDSAAVAATSKKNAIARARFIYGNEKKRVISVGTSGRLL